MLDHTLMTSRRTSHVALAMCALSVAMAGCTRTSPFSQQPVTAVQRQAAPLQPAPLTPVNEAALQPVKPETNNIAATGIPPEPPVEPVKVASAPPANNGKPLTRQAMVGAWTVSSNGTNCQIFLSLTKWSGGYRAAQRACAGAGLGSVSAWDVKGSQIVLVDNSGRQVASLYRSRTERYDGSTASGSSISFSR